MQLYIMRHGQADPGGISDANRPLTHQGELEARLMANYLLSIDAKIDHILVSPFLRAKQTADALVDALKQPCDMTICDLITPEGFAAQAHDYIDAFIADTDIKHLLVVSHMPMVSYLTAEMTIEHNAPIFPTAAIAHIDYDQAKMKGPLVAHTSPFDIAQ